MTININPEEKKKQNIQQMIPYLKKNLRATNKTTKKLKLEQFLLISDSNENKAITNLNIKLKLFMQTLINCI